MTIPWLARLGVRWLLALLAGIAFACPAQAQEAVDDGASRQILVLTNLPQRHFSVGPGYGDGYGDAAAHNAQRRMAKRIARQYGLKLVDDWPMPLIGLDCFVMDVPASLSPEQAAKLLSADPLVAFAEPMHEYRGQGGSPLDNDPLYQAEPAARLWRLADLHQISTGRNVAVAVIDSGVDGSHPDLAGQISVNRNFVAGRAAAAEQHGTGVAGIIAAKGGNGLGIVGVAPQARLLALRACWQRGSTAGTVCDTLSLAKALHFAIDSKAQVINLSLAGPPDILLARLLQVAADRGISIVAAYDRSLPGGGFPASQSGVIRVSDEMVAGQGGEVYVAPGRDVLTTQPGGRWNLVNGSSFAAAHVSGLVALIRAGRTIGARQPVLLSAGGMLDACATLLRARGPCDCACAGPSRSAGAMRR